MPPKSKKSAARSKASASTTKAVKAAKKRSVRKTTASKRTPGKSFVAKEFGVAPSGDRFFKANDRVRYIGTEERAAYRPGDRGVVTQDQLHTGIVPTRFNNNSKVDFPHHRELTRL